MSKNGSPATAPITYSSQVLEGGVGRTTKLLNGICADPMIRTLMEQGGMTDDDITEGSKLLSVVLTQPPRATAELDTEDARRQRAATAELDQWDEPNFARFGATLRRHFPSAADYVFHELAPSTGAAAVAGVATFLSRIATLEKGDDPARAGTRKEDKKAVELLAKRGLDKEERSRLAALVELAFRPTAALPAPRELDAKRATARTTALVALRDWYEEWAAIARVVVKRRDYRIRMGIAARKSRKQAAVPPAPMVVTAAKPA